MILADTSVWIRKLNRRPGYEAEVGELLDRDEIAGHDLVYGELLAGDSGGRGPFLADYTTLTWLAQVAHHEVVLLARARKLCGRGIGWIDMHLLAAALASGARLWTADERLAAMAEELRVGWRPR